MERLRRFQDGMQNRSLELASVVDPEDGGGKAVRMENACVQAWHDQRLTLAWLDGKMQRVGATTWDLEAGRLGAGRLGDGRLGGWGLEAGMLKADFRGMGAGFRGIGGVVFLGFWR